MRVIICGAGQVGYSIAAYLSRENNDVTVVDTNHEEIVRVNMELDANGFYGAGSDPEILAAAGAKDADMIIAVTREDEVNMVACQVAHSLFNVPKKIARIRNKVYLNPTWANLFSRAHMPIDVIISPEVEVAKRITQRLAVPGTTTAIPMADNKVYLCGIICQQDCPLVNTPLQQLIDLFPDMNMNIVTIVRGKKAFIPKPDNQMLIGDEVFFMAETSQLDRIMKGFGYDQTVSQNITIVGGGNIARNIIEDIQQSKKPLSIKVIEKDTEVATRLSEDFENIIVLNADGLEKNVFEEANVAQMDSVIAVTNDDEANILMSLLAQQHGCKQTIPLVNKGIYNVLTSSLGLGAVVSSKAITVSTIMRSVRRGRVKAVHNMLGEFAEVLEIEASDSIPILNTPLRDISFPQSVLIGMIIRGDEIIVPNGDTTIKDADHIIMLAANGDACKVEKMFSPHVDLF